jgi:hypothetical protein
MEVSIASTGEKYEEPSLDELLKRWTTASDTQFAIFNLLQSLEEGTEDWQVISKAWDVAYRRNQDAMRTYERAAAHQQFADLLADSLERGEWESKVEHYDSQLPPCGIDTVDPDPRFEDQAAAIADDQADALAFEQESQS